MMHAVDVLAAGGSRWPLPAIVPRVQVQREWVLGTAGEETPGRGCKRIDQGDNPARQQPNPGGNSSRGRYGDVNRERGSGGTYARFPAPIIASTASLSWRSCTSG